MLRDNIEIAFDDNYNVLGGRLQVYSKTTWDDMKHGKKSNKRFVNEIKFDILNQLYGDISKEISNIIDEFTPEPEHCCDEPEIPLVVERLDKLRNRVWTQMFGESEGPSLRRRPGMLSKP